MGAGERDVLEGRLRAMPDGPLGALHPSGQLGPLQPPAAPGGAAEDGGDPRRDRLKCDLRRRFLEMHPYEVPEFLPLVVEENGANPAYLDWIRKP